MAVHSLAFLTVIGVVCALPTLPETPFIYSVLGVNQSPASVNVPISGMSAADAQSLPVVEPAYVSFAFEQVSFLSYFGTPSRPNTFSVNLVNQVTGLTNTQPHIRVGGSSLDNGYYVPSQKRAAIVPPSQRMSNTPDGVKYGPSYFNTFGVMPSALYTIDLPLLTDNLTNTLEYAKAAYSAIGSSSIEQLEVGQEPSLYEPDGYRPKTYGPTQYIAQWAKYTSAVSKELGIPLNQPTYTAISIYGPPSLDPVNPVSPKWNVEPLFKEGLLKYKSRMTSVGIHYYQTEATPQSNLQRDLMNHTAVTIKLDYYKPAIDYSKSLGLHPIFEEVGSSYNGAHNDYRLESVLGSTLWNIDFLLYSMSLGAYRVNYQQGVAFGYSLWTPVAARGRLPAVQIPYYGHLFAASFLGAGGPVKVANLDLNSDLLSSYAAYDAQTGGLLRVAIVNFQFWSRFYNVNPRPKTDFNVGAPSGATSATVKYLSSDVGATASHSHTVTFGGEAYTYKSKGLPYRPKNLQDTVTLPVKNGNVVVPLNATQAALVEFNFSGY